MASLTRTALSPSAAYFADRRPLFPVRMASVQMPRVRPPTKARTYSKWGISPILRYYPPGSELQVVRRENGWVLVVDPATAARGWIYEKYYLSWIGGPTSTQAALAPSDETSQSPQSKPAPPKVTKHSGTAKAKSQRSEPWMVTEYRTGKWRTADRRRRMGFFVFGRFGGF